MAGGWIQKWTDHTNLLKPVIDAGDSRHRQGPPSPQKGQQNLTKPDIKRRRIGLETVALRLTIRVQFNLEIYTKYFTLPDIIALV